MLNNKRKAVYNIQDTYESDTIFKIKMIRSDIKGG